MNTLNQLTGIGSLIRLILRRDRFLLLIWVILPLLTVQGQVSFINALPDWESFLAELTANPLTTAWLGPVVPLTTTGAIIWRSALQAAMVSLIASVLLVIRHTRADETTGRSELLRSGIVGRHALLTAVLIVVCIANLIAGLLVSIALIGAGEAIDGSIILGLTIAATGWFFAGIAALTAQIWENAGTARWIALALLPISMIFMVINHVGGAYTFWAWLSPMTWYRVTEPFAGNRFIALILLYVITAIPIAAAYVLSVRRDLGSGLLQSRPGSAYAAPNLRDPLSLAWRLHRGTLIGWSIGLIFITGALGLVVPGVSGDLSTMLTDIWPERWVTMVETVGNHEALIAIFVYVMALLVGVTIYAFTTVLNLRQEERENRVDLPLSTPVSRIKWMSSYLIIAFAGSSVLLLLSGLAMGLGWGIAINDLGSILPKVLGMSLSKIPVVWVLVGIAAIAYGIFPRFAHFLVWGLWGLFVLIEMLWEAQVIDWSVMQISPYAYAHYTTPINELAILPLLLLIVLAMGLTAIGIFSMQRRDIG
ncbi:MAG: hypothetical protein AAGF95_06535 [Chloroflexota bacterium]